jgi:phosphohistidine phosphatase
MRHGKAETPVTAYQERHLTERGKKEADAAGAFLRMAGEIPDIIMHSTQLRSRETAERAMAAITAEDILTARKDLEEDADPEEFLASVSAEYGRTGKKILAVGHNPFVSRLASIVIRGGRASMMEDLGTGDLVGAESVGSKMWRLRFFMPSATLSELYASWGDIAGELGTGSLP